MNDIQFPNAAGKVAGALSGTYEDTGGTSTPEGSGSSVTIVINSNGTVDINMTNLMSTQVNWYTGGTPTGTTNFEIVTTVTQAIGGSSQTGTASGTVNRSFPTAGSNFTAAFVSAGQTGPGSAIRTANVQITVTRNSQSVVYNFTISASSTV